MADPATYPVGLRVEHQAEYSRFMPLIKWLLAIPHYLALFFVIIAAFFVLIAAFFAVLFTGRYPRGMWNFLAGTKRWNTRVAAYVYLMTDAYPPFSLGEEPDYPVRLEIAYPEEGVANWRPLVHWLLAIPYAIVAGIIYSLAGLVSFFALFTILFTKKFPVGMFNVVLNGLLWNARAIIYTEWMVEPYPPFDWE